MESVTRRDVLELKAGFAANVAAVSGLGEKMAGLDTKVSGLDARVAGLEAKTTDLYGVSRRMIATLVRLEDKMDDMAERMATKDDIRVMNSRLDDFTADIQAARRDRALQSETFMAGQRRLDDHELRITRLETRKS